MINLIETFLINHYILWIFLIWFFMYFSNIFPLMFFLLPDVTLLIAMYVAIKTHLIFLSYISLLIWWFLGEITSYIIWYKFWHKILEHNFIKKRISDKELINIKKRWIWGFVIWRMTPWIGRFMPLFAGIMKIKPLTFISINWIIYVSWISILFFSGVYWYNFLQEHFATYLPYIISIIIFIIFFSVILWIIKKK